MVRTLGYADLSMDRADSVLSEDGELLVSLPEKHGRACVAFIETVRTVQSWPANRTPFVARLWPLLKSFGVTLRVLIGHAKLFELSRVIVLIAPRKLGSAALMALSFSNLSVSPVPFNGARCLRT